MPRQATPQQRPRARRPFARGVPQIINHAVDARVSTAQARLRFSVVCRDAAELDHAVQVFERWRAYAGGPT
ncbi:MAG TPA: hypothetical protein VF595_00480 [Tepidisphaeraceae bacterium]|jgi:hypothetical protein